MTDFPVQTPAQLSAHLRSLRKSRGLTQAQLGALLGVNQTRVAKIERNPGSVSVDQLLALLTALGAQVVLQPRGSRPVARAGQRAKAEW
jgi:HTH-type transcriptional regulator/antitoxin HipB